jgi:hypothetical protein
MKLSKSEAYTAALIFYNAAKNAAKSKVQTGETTKALSQQTYPILKQQNSLSKMQCFMSKRDNFN